jgi:predicted phage terminase large subunit-like protein
VHPDIITRQAQTRNFGMLGIDLPTDSIGDEIYASTRANGRKSLYFFTTAILGWNKLRQHPHLEMCNFIQRLPPEPGAKRRKLLLVPRDCFKSTVASKSFPIWVLVQEEYLGLPGLEHRILLTSHSGDNSAKQIKSLRAQIERSEMLQWLFPEIIPDFGKTTWTDRNLLFPRQGMYGEDTIEAVGVESHVTSRHYTIMVHDDLEDKQSAEQPSVRQKVKTFYRSSESLFVDSETAFELTVGTRWGIDDVYADIMRDEYEYVETMVRPISWTREELEADFAQAEEDKTLPTYNMDPDTYAPEVGKTYLFFPDHFPEHTIERVATKQGSFLFSMLYRNNPKDPSLSEFQMDQVIWSDLDTEGNIVLSLPDGSKELVDLDMCTRVLFWDPAMGKRDTKNGARNAMVCAAIDRKKRVHFLDAFAEKKKPELCIGKFVAMHQRWRVHRAAIEDIGFQKYLKFPIYHFQKEVNYTFPIRNFPVDVDKEARIRSLIPYNESGSMSIRRGLKVLIEEMKNFPQFMTVDVLDAAASCVELGRGGAGVEQSNPRARAESAARNASRNSSTGY